jgi:hypothetical protein
VNLLSQSTSSLTLATLAVAALFAGADSRPAASSELEPRTIVVTRGADTLGVTGEHFAFTWDAATGGEVRSIRLHDGLVWRELLARETRRATVPSLLVTTTQSKQGTLGPFARGELKVLEEGPERVVIESRSHLATEKGKASELELTQTYVVYPEGALFIDFVLELKPGAKSVTIQRAAVGVPMSLAGYTLSFWHWQRAGVRGSGFLEPQPVFTSAYCPNLGLALGTFGNLSNQIQITLEAERGLSGKDLVASAIRDGKTFLHWLHPEQAGPLTLEAPYRYANRLGVLLGRHPERSRVSGHRVAHWTENARSGMIYPSPSAIEAMARVGVTAVVLDESWRKRGPEPLAPAEPEAFTRLLADLKAQGIRCLVTVSPGGDGEALGRAARAAGIAGLFLKNSSAHHGWNPESGRGAAGDTATGASASDAAPDAAPEAAGGPGALPARASFEWGRALRRGLGADGILIQHTGLEVPDLTLGLHADGVAFGIERADWRAARSTLANAYLGGAGYAVPCPLLTMDPMRTDRSLAVAAATASVPLVPVGFGPDRSAYQARYALPLWQIQRLVPPGPEVEVRTNGVRTAAASSNADFWSAVYRMEGGAVLLITANLSVAKVDSTTLLIDFPGLGLSGDYDVQLLHGTTIEDLQVTYLGKSSGGQIKTGPVPRFGILGFLYTPGNAPVTLASALDQSTAVMEAFNNRRAPAAVPQPAAHPVTGGIGLAWDPATGPAHVSSYRIYRSPDPTFARPERVAVLGDVFEETSFRDFDVSPGETWSYAVAARDVAGLEGEPSKVVTATMPKSRVGQAFGDSAAAKGFNPVAGAWAWHDSAYGSGCTPGVAHPMGLSLENTLELADVEIGAVVKHQGVPFSGGVVARATSLAEGGYALYVHQNSELVLAKLADGRLLPLASVPFAYDHVYRPALSLKLVAQGEELMGYADDRLLITATDRTYTRGRAGFLALDGHVHFDNLTIRAPESPRAGSGGSP